MTPCACPDAVPLGSLLPGQAGRLVGTTLGLAEENTLAAMGLCRDATVRVCRAGSTCIVAVSCSRGSACRIGLGRRLADAVLVSVGAT